MSRLKKGSIVHQTLQKLLDQQAFGTSKHEAKEANGGKPPRDKIYSFATFENYKQAAIRFAKWAREEHGCRTLEDARAFASEYLEERQQRGLSAWTVNLDASAIAKVYGCASSELGTRLPERRRSDVVRSRSADRSAGGHYSEERHRDIQEICQACGLRRHELAALRPEDVQQQGERIVVHVRQGKGGKERWVTALNDKPLVYAQKAREAGQDRVIEHIPKNAPIHAYRGDFAKALYRNTARDITTLTSEKKYICRGDRKGTVLDRSAMQIVSKALGHNRLDVVTAYLYPTGEFPKAD